MSGVCDALQGKGSMSFGKSDHVVARREENHWDMVLERCNLSLEIALALFSFQVSATQLTLPHLLLEL